ncbi:TatD family hydrolase [Selenomonadales bacterium OttesenSCG-928-I06]|nr:TatD family hydrolase [Selenomonadales bacterium OttesenSCG-928-I06]
MLFDSHAHVDDRRFSGEVEEVLKRALEQDVTNILNVGADMESSARAVMLSEEYNMVYASVGIHPHDAKDAKNADYYTLAEWTNQNKVVAIGEIGLDYYHNHSPKEIQQEVFIRQLDVARQTKMPFIIHDRDAHKDILDIIKKEAKGMPGVFHCFSGSVEMAREVIKMGYYISIAGPVTFSNANKLKEVAKSIPLERLLIETDCPYLTPHPHRGTRNEPAYVRLVAEEIAGLKEIKLEKLASVTTSNTKELFGIV